MPYAILYIENGDFVADFDSVDEARTALRDFLADQPAVRDRVGILEFDADGQPVGELQTADAHEVQPA